MPKKSNRKPRKGAWFIPVRGSYLPASWQGWLTYIPFTAYLIFALHIGWTGSKDLAHMILLVIPNWIAALYVMTLLARHKS